MVNKIEIRRFSYYLYNYEPKDSPSLEKSLSVYDFISRKYTHHGFVYDKESKILKIPVSVDLSFIMDKLCSDGVIVSDIVNNSDKFIESRRSKSIICKATPRNNTQKEAIEFIVGTSASDKHRSQRLLTLCTGFGKTVCAIAGAIELQMPTVVISVNLSKQWVERLLEFTDGELGKDIIHIKTWSDLDSLLEMKDPPIAGFYIIGLDAAIAALKYDSNKLNTFYKRFGIGMQIFDEAHSHFIKIINVLVNTNCERTLYLTATPARSERSQDNLYRRLFTLNIPSYGEHTHDVNKFNIIFVRYATEPGYFDKMRVEPRRGVHAVAFFKYLFRRKDRYFKLVDILNYFSFRIMKMYNYDTNKKVIVYIQSLEAIKEVKTILNLMNPIDGFKPTIGDYSGNVDKKVRHLELEKNIILTTLANNAGLDIGGLIMVINFVPMSSPILIKQIMGRIRDKKGYYVDAYDSGFTGIIRQKEKREIFYKKISRNIVFYEHNGVKIEKSFS